MLDSRKWSGFAVAAALTLAACPGACPDEDTTTVTAERPECPHTWNFRELARPNMDAVPTTLAVGQTSASKEITNVPEFHDCQRFLTQGGGGMVYDSIFAIFASIRLPGFDSLRGAEALEGRAPFAAAEIYAEGPYAPLNIEPGFNCLYVYQMKGDWVATMQSAGWKEVDCSVPMVFSEPPNLGVVRTTPMGAALADRGKYPPVARWDYDDANKQYYVGIMCGIGWCEVHSRDLPRAAGFQTSPTHAAGAASPPGTNVMLGVKGWYDEQILARYDAGDPRAQPTDVTATIVPDPKLGDYNSEDEFKDKWVRVAEVRMRVGSDYYQTKLNLSETTSDAVNEFWLCAPVSGCPGSESLPSPECKARMASDTTIDAVWLMKIKNAKTGNEEVFCAPRRAAEPGVVVPATARLRWQADDETAWVRCVQGCCAVEP